MTRQFLWVVGGLLVVLLIMVNIEHAIRSIY